ncbi:MAG: CLC_0170 family protein [Sedimentibacter sp.]
MFFINEIKHIIHNDIIIIFFVISYILIFSTSKELKRNNYHKDYKIVRTTGIIYGILAIAAAVAILI